MSNLIAHLGLQEFDNATLQSALDTVAVDHPAIRQYGPALDSADPAAFVRSMLDYASTNGPFQNRHAGAADADEAGRYQAVWAFLGELGRRTGSR